jgi:hypothetical protein
MMTTTPRRTVSGLRTARTARGSKRHRPARQFRPRSSGTIPRKDLASVVLPAGMPSVSVVSVAVALRARAFESGSGPARASR